MSTAAVPTTPLEAASGVLAGIGLGGNLGDVPTTLRQAVDALAQLPQTRLVAASSFYRSAPVDAVGPDFVNAAVLLETSLEPPALLAELHRIEGLHGRERSKRNAPRTLDLDLLFHGDARLATSTLTVPHPRLHERAFVLVPLAEIAPDHRLPGLGPVTSLLGGVASQQVERLGPPGESGT